MWTIKIRRMSKAMCDSNTHPCLKFTYENHMSIRCQMDYCEYFSLATEKRKHVMNTNTDFHIQFRSVDNDLSLFNGR